MIRTILKIVMILASMTSIATAAKPFTCNDKAAALILMTKADQALRGRLDRATAALSSNGKHPKLVDNILLVDRTNTKNLVNYLNECGWPKTSEYGKEVSTAAWLIAQHADAAPDKQKIFLKALTEAHAKGEAESWHMAFLTDRVSVNKGGPQKYGTQFEPDGECRMKYVEVDNIKSVNLRRAKLGWEGLDEYLEKMNEHLGKNCSASSS